MTSDGVMKNKHSNIGNFEFDGVDDFDAKNVVTKSQSAKGCIPEPWVEEIRDDHDEPSSLCGAGNAAQPGGEVGTARLWVIEGAKDSSQERLHMNATRSSWNRWGCAIGSDGHRSNAVARASGEETSCRNPRKRKVALFTSCGAKCERRRCINKDPGFQFAIGDAVTHMGLAESGGDVPIDATNVVTRLIGTNFARLGTVSGGEPAMVALQESVESAGDSDFESAEDFRGGGSVD
jgi:hypothetical protein